ncbi:dormancy-associated protein homolog 4-like [Primulina huaijiensis]|uniref:dormancy-associated protein homolog 4-like n=1 Tax=Primulina huaijiensis TaxID=1492673 RepID=UPI003CC78A88
MGFLHKLWDETLAEPTPESGLVKLRKYNSFSGIRSPDPPATMDAPDDRVQIFRCITIVRNNNNIAPANCNLNVFVDSPSAPSSPTSCSTPTSPFSHKNLGFVLSVCMIQIQLAVNFSQLNQIS